MVDPYLRTVLVLRIHFSDLQAVLSTVIKHVELLIKVIGKFACVEIMDRNSLLAVDLVLGRQQIYCIPYEEL